MPEALRFEQSLTLQVTRLSRHLFKDRAEAGRQLSTHLLAYADARAVVLGLPRGGVPVAYEVAAALNLPLDVCIARKLGAPRHKELAMGAIARGGVCHLNSDVIEQLSVSEATLEQVIEAEQQELERRYLEYRRGQPPLDLSDLTVILVDDGLATGATLLAAIKSLKRQPLWALVVAVPVAAAAACQTLAPEVDRVVCAHTPQSFYSVGRWYQSFAQTTDQEVQDLLHRAHCRQSSSLCSSSPSSPAPQATEYG